MKIFGRRPEDFAGNVIGSKQQHLLTPNHWSDKLYLLSPRTWLGVLQICSQNAFAPIDVDALIEAIKALLIPIIVLWALNVDAHLVLASPWAYAMVRQAVPPVKAIAKMSQFWIQRRTNALPECVDCLQQGIQNGSVARRCRYDVFIPPTDRYDGEAIVLLPGAMIAHTAYAQIASSLSGTGIAVVVLSMEPTRMARQNLGADQDRIKRIMKETNALLPTNVKRWAIVGHSLGSFAAMRLVAETDLFAKLVMWASINRPRTRSNLSQSTAPTLVIQGSCDKLTEMSKEAFEEFKEDFPPGTHYETIDGAGHMWFASIPPGDPLILGDPTISMQEQQDKVISITSDFVKNQIWGRSGEGRL